MVIGCLLSFEIKGKELLSAHIHVATLRTGRGEQVVIRTYTIHSLTGSCIAAVTNELDQTRELVEKERNRMHASAARSGG